MRKLFIAISVLIVLIIVIAIIFVFTKQQQPQNQSQYTYSPTPAASVKVSPPISNNFCNPSQLQGQLSTEGAAGSIFINATLKNSSSTPCDILGGSFILATYNRNLRNISQVHQGKANSQTITLPAGKTIYAQIKAQNGPQCSGTTNQTPVDFVYQISPIYSLEFNGPNNQTVLLQTCTNPKEITRIDISQFSEQPTK